MAAWIVQYIGPELAHPDPDALFTTIAADVANAEPANATPPKIVTNVAIVTKFIFVK